MKRLVINSTIMACLTIFLSGTLEAKVFKLNELEVGACSQLVYDDQTGGIELVQDETKCKKPLSDGPSAFRMILTLDQVYKDCCRVGVVIRNTDASFDDYKWKPVKVNLFGLKKYKNSNTLLTTTKYGLKLTLPENLKNKINKAILDNKKFNIGVYGNDYWSTNLFHVSKSDIENTKNSSKRDFKSSFATLPLQKRKNVQSILKAYNYYNSSIDGLYGAGTKKALNSYQSKRLISTNIFDELLDDYKYLGAIHVSSDLNLYAVKMIKNAKDLVSNGSCSFKQLVDFGGWVKSGLRKGQYFIDCGNDRYWMKPGDATNTIQSDKHVSEKSIRDACWKSIKEKSPRSKIQPFNNNYTKHKIGSVTYVQGFKVKNAFGQTEKYFAYCVAQNDRTFTIKIELQ